MLDEAQAKGCYRALQQVDLNQPLQIAADTYDAVICIGTFTLGHVQPEALHGMLRITKSGGRLCFTVRDEFWLKSNFGSLLNELEQAGQVELSELQTIGYVSYGASRTHFDSFYQVKKMNCVSIYLPTVPNFYKKFLEL